ncbi:diguanylate cyclase domain-containing protein [Orenia marismortui]
MRLTVSLGVSYSKGNLDLETIIEGAGKALYQAKKNARNRVAVV